MAETNQCAVCVFGESVECVRVCGLSTNPYGECENDIHSRHR